MTENKPIVEYISKNQCLRCGGRMIAVGFRQIQLGTTGIFAKLFLGGVSNIAAGTLKVEVMICEDCSKVEFYSYEGVSDKECGAPPIKQIECPVCGYEHDFDYPKCPYCKYDYYDTKLIEFD